jgi:hypothetical protein
MMDENGLGSNHEPESNVFSIVVILIAIVLAYFSWQYFSEVHTVLALVDR